MISLANILRGDRTDLDLIQLALETLTNVMTYEADNSEGRNRNNVNVVHQEYVI